MARTHYKALLQKALIGFLGEEDPVLAMLQWVAQEMKQIWLQPDKKSARRAAAQLTQEYGNRFPEAFRCREENLEDSLQFYGFPEVDPKKISSTNMSERTGREFRRRSRVIGVFPTTESRKSGCGRACWR